jgi:hypothetical protein
MENMVQAQKANDTGIATVKHADHPAKQRNQRMGFWSTLGITVVAIVWLIGGEITGNKRRLIL